MTGRYSNQLNYHSAQTLPAFADREPLIAFRQKPGVPTGIRTPVIAVKGRCPRPLDDGDPEQLFYCSTLPAGGGKRDRTADLLHAMQALSQLSYTPDSERARILSMLFLNRKSFLLAHHIDLEPTQQITGGVDGARTRDPRRDRPVF